MSRASIFVVGTLLLAACKSDGSSVDLGDADLSMPGVTDTDAAQPITGDLAAADLTSVGNPYASPGPSASTTTTATASLAGSQFTITIYIPAGAGPFPVVAISPGFGQPGTAYTPYADRLASFGIAVLLRDDPGFSTASTTAAEQLTDEIKTWLPAENAKAAGPLFGKVDLTKVGLMGHSRGGQASLLAATGELHGKIASFFGLDPVDTSAGGATSRGALPTIGIPTAFMGETLDGTSIFGFGMACAPTADNYAVLYGVAPTPSLLLTVNNAAHFDFELRSKAVGAGICATGTADATQVLDLAVALSTGFFARELLGKSAVGVALDGAGAAGYIQTGLLTRTQK